jgi:hypothetical protein
MLTLNVPNKPVALPPIVAIGATLPSAFFENSTIGLVESE